MAMSKRRSADINIENIKLRRQNEELVYALGQARNALLIAEEKLVWIFKNDKNPYCTIDSVRHGIGICTKYMSGV